MSLALSDFTLRFRYDGLYTVSNASRVILMMVAAADLRFLASN